MYPDKITEYKTNRYFPHHNTNDSHMQRLPP